MRNIDLATASTIEIARTNLLQATEIDSSTSHKVIKKKKKKKKSKMKPIIHVQGVAMCLSFSLTHTPVTLFSRVITWNLTYRLRVRVLYCENVDNFFFFFFFFLAVVSTTATAGYVL